METCAAILSHICLTFDSQILIYALIALAMLIEGEIFLLVAGSMVYFGLLDFGPLVLAAILGTWLSDIFWYEIGVRFGERFISRHGWWFFITPERFLKIKNVIQKRGFWMVFVSKFSYGLNHLFLLAAGASEFGFKRFLRYQMPVSALWALAFVFLGKMFAFGLDSVKHDIKLFGLGMLILILLVLLFERLFGKNFLKKFNGQNGIENKKS